MKLSASRLLLAVTSLGSLACSAAKEHVFVPPNIRGLQDGGVTIGDEGDNTTIEEGKEGIGDPNSACCADDDLETLTFNFTRGTCAATMNDQKDKDEQCSGGVGTATTRPITLFNAEFVGPGNPTRRMFATGEEFTIKPASGSKKNKFDSNTEIRVGGQYLKIHTSCSQPLNFGDVFGSLTVVNSSPRPVPECVFCLDDKPRGGKDTGCNDDCPLCAAPMFGEAGDECRVCLNDRRGAKQDSGCPIETPVCVAPFMQFGDECAVCKVGNFPGMPDMGCGVEKPICNSDETGCFKCQNDVEFDLDGPRPPPDSGCPARYRHCVAPLNGFGNECASCVNDGAPVSDGCTLDAPVCVADWWAGGILCAKCVNDEGDTMLEDSGCGGPKKLCEADLGEPGRRCRECITDNLDPNGRDGGCPPDKRFCGVTNDDGSGRDFEYRCNGGLCCGRLAGLDQVAVGWNTIFSDQEPLIDTFGECFECRYDYNTWSVVGCDIGELCAIHGGSLGNSAGTSLATAGLGNLGTCESFPCGLPFLNLGSSEEVIRVELGESSGNFSFSYNPFGILAKFDIVYEGDTIFSTNFTTSAGTVDNISYSGRSTFVLVSVTGPDSFLFFSFTVSCPNNSLPATHEENEEIDICEFCKTACAKFNRCDQAFCDQFCDAEN